MNKAYIHNKVIEYKTKIKQIQDPTSFVLDPRLRLLKEQIEILQAECDHKESEEWFALDSHGYCKYCDKRIIDMEEI